MLRLFLCLVTSLVLLAAQSQPIRTMQADLSVYADTGTKTSSFYGKKQVSGEFKGAIITVVTAAASGTTTPTFSVSLQYSYDGTNWLDYGDSTVAITASTKKVCLIYYPAAVSTTTGADVTKIINAVLPRTWRPRYRLGGTDPSFRITGVYINYLY